MIGHTTTQAALFWAKIQFVVLPSHKILAKANSHHWGDSNEPPKMLYNKNDNFFILFIKLQINFPWLISFFSALNFPCFSSIPVLKKFFLYIYWQISYVFIVWKSWLQNSLFCLCRGKRERWNISLKQNTFLFMISRYLFHDDKYTVVLVNRMSRCF